MKDDKHCQFKISVPMVIITVILAAVGITLQVVAILNIISVFTCGDLLWAILHSVLAVIFELMSLFVLFTAMYDIISFHKNKIDTRSIE